MLEFIESIFHTYIFVMFFCSGTDDARMCDKCVERTELAQN